MGKCQMGKMSNEKNVKREKCQMGKFKMSNGKCQMGMSNGNVKWEMSNGKNVKWEKCQMGFSPKFHIQAILLFH